MTVAENIEAVKMAIRKAAEAHGDDAAAVKIVAVSKMQPADRIAAALQAGHRIFGENRVQEAAAHWRDLRVHYPDLELHLIGPLQTNKVKEAVALFDVIQSVDREKLVRALSDEMKKQGRALPCFIQVNTGAEEQKAGIAPSQLPGFLEFCRGECALNIAGLMCIPPVDEPPALHFALLKKLAAEHDLPHLSMGMSSDYERAVALGATHVRIGAAIFGNRE